MVLAARIFLIFAIAVCCVPFAGQSKAAPGDDAPVFRQGRNIADLAGVWRSRGYGWLVSVEGGQARFYDESSSHCISDPDAGEDLSQFAEGFEITAGKTAMRLPLGDAAYKYTFDRIAALPGRCRAAPDADPVSVVDAVIDIFSRHYAFFGIRSIDWPGLAKAARARVNAGTTAPQLLGVIQDLLSHFDDDHVSLAAHVAGRDVIYNTGAGKTLRSVSGQPRRGELDASHLHERWMRNIWVKEIGGKILAGTGVRAANGKVIYGLIGGDIGYLAVRSMEDFADDETDDEPGDLAALDKAMDGALALFERARAVIVDVSINDGGFDTAARLLAGRFAEQRTLGYYKYAGDSPADRRQAVFVEPSRKRRYLGPVYLLTSDVTVSAAEILTLSMRALPNVIHVGERTRGALSDMLWKPLPNGWTLSLSNEVYLDRDGRLWEGTGIPPDLALQVFAAKDVAAGHRRAVRLIAERARRR